MDTHRSPDPDRGPDSEFTGPANRREASDLARQFRQQARAQPTSSPDHADVRRP